MIQTNNPAKFRSGRRAALLLSANTLLLIAAAVLVYLAIGLLNQENQRESGSRLRANLEYGRQLQTLQSALQDIQRAPELMSARTGDHQHSPPSIPILRVGGIGSLPDSEMRRSVKSVQRAVSGYLEHAASVSRLYADTEESAATIDRWMDRLEQIFRDALSESPKLGYATAEPDTKGDLAAAIRTDWRTVQRRYRLQRAFNPAGGSTGFPALSPLLSRIDQARERLSLMSRHSASIATLERLDRALLNHRALLVRLHGSDSNLVNQYTQLVADGRSALERIQALGLTNTVQAEQEQTLPGRLYRSGATPFLLISVLFVLVSLFLTAIYLRRFVSRPLRNILMQIDQSAMEATSGIDDEWQRVETLLSSVQGEKSSQLDAIRSSESRYRLLVEQQGDLIVRLDADGRFEFVSSTYCETFGKSQDQLLGAASPITLLAKGRGEEGGTMMDLYRPPYECVLEQRSETIRGWRWISWNHKALRDSKGNVEAIVSVGRDVTERKLAQLELEGQRHFLHTVIDAVADPIVVIRRDYQLQMYNAAARRSYDLSDDAESDLPKGFCHKLMHDEEAPCQHPGRPCALDQVMQSGRPTTVLHLLQTVSGERTFELTASPYRDSEGEILGVVQVSRDITEKLKAEDRIRFLAHHDALTGLPNRVLLRDRFHQAAQQADRDGQSIALLFLDLDHFKHVNDTLGHKVGDKLLQHVVHRLSAAVRGSDTVSRLGGDEFVMVLSQRGEIDAVNRISSHVLRVLNETFQIDGHELRLSASIGISRYPQDGKDFDDLLKKADSAMYVAKESGRNGCRFYQAEMSQVDISRLQLLNAMQRALDKEDFKLLYQPQVELDVGRLVGFEALVSWQSRTLGRLRPGQFVSLAEESGLIVPLGNWVLRQACHQVAAWNNQAGTDLPVAVNLSALQIRQESFVDLVVNTLAESGLPAELLELELTESILLQDTDKVLVAVKALQELGVKLTMDDFGTGYSSLSYLKKFNLTGLKIDRSFVADLTSEGDDATIVRAIIQMGHGLGLTVIAEGVETVEQVDWLKREGCKRGQGYFFHRPMDAEGIKRLLGLSGGEVVSISPQRAERSEGSAY